MIGITRFASVRVQKSRNGTLNRLRPDMNSPHSVSTQAAKAQVKRLQAETAAQRDALLPAILARAFAGQLVPQDPTDEPAEKLLERIRNTQTNKA